MYRQILYIVYFADYGMVRTYFFWPGDASCFIILLN